IVLKCSPSAVNLAEKAMVSGRLEGSRVTSSSALAAAVPGSGSFSRLSISRRRSRLYRVCDDGDAPITTTSSPCLSSPLSSRRYPHVVVDRGGPDQRTVFGHETRSGQVGPDDLLGLAVDGLGRDQLLGHLGRVVSQTAAPPPRA